MGKMLDLDDAVGMSLSPLAQQELEELRAELFAAYARIGRIRQAYAEAFVTECDDETIEMPRPQYQKLVDAITNSR